MRLLRQPRDQPSIIPDTIALRPQQVHVRRRAEQPLLQVLPESVIDGERDDQRCHARGDPDDRDRGDHADDRLPALSAQISRRDEELEAQVLSVTNRAPPTPRALPVRTGPTTATLRSPASANR